MRGFWSWARPGSAINSCIAVRLDPAFGAIMKAKKRLVHITMDESVIGNADRMTELVQQIEAAFGEKTMGSLRMRKCGIVSALVDEAGKDAVSQPPGIIAVEEDSPKLAS